MTAEITGQDELWKHVAVSADGTKMVARSCDLDGTPNGKAYTYPNQMGEWELQEFQDAGVPRRHTTWSSVAMSSDGDLLLLTDSWKLRTLDSGVWRDPYDFGFPSLDPDSNPGGATTKFPEDVDKSCVAVSSTASRLVCGAWPGLLYMSDNQGVSWQELNPQPTPTLGNDNYRGWECMAISSNGDTIIVGAWPGRLFYGTCVNRVVT